MLPLRLNVHEKSPGLAGALCFWEKGVYQAWGRLPMLTLVVR